jgi:hypothetical protein
MSSYETKVIRDLIYLEEAQASSDHQTQPPPIDDSDMHPSYVLDKFEDSRDMVLTNMMTVVYHFHGNGKRGKR